MSMVLDTAACRNFESTINLEWLITNGCGGYASSTVAGANSRKYHGYMVVAAKPPVDRYVVLSHVEDRCILNSTSYDLATDEFPDIIHPQGYLNLLSFEMKHGPIWRYQIGDAVVEKSITLVHGEDTLIVKYELVAPAGHPPVLLQVQPMLAGRDFHGTIQGHYRPSWGIPAQTAASMELSAPECPVKLNLSHNAQKFTSQTCWWYNFIFRQERLRGYPDREDLWTPGMLEFQLEPGKPAGFICSTKNIAWDQQATLIEHEKARYESLQHSLDKQAPGDKFLSQLAVAADQFLVQRTPPSGPNKPGQMTVIAGYPWFEDWGRDTFISLPGLALVTGRYDIARSILVTFADYICDGLVPNRFPDKASTPEYHTVDAAMWFIQAAYEYWRYSGDSKLLTEYLYRPLCQIMDKYREGTRHGIRMDNDGLIRAGEPHVQLTWMDAKVGDWVVTPRHGKPVEINALWYNNLRIMSKAAALAGDSARSQSFAALADQTCSSFNEKFWNRSSECLYDVIDDDGAGDPSVRPNQVFAVSLPFSPLDDNRARKVIDNVQQSLLTPMGLRTLAPGSLGYHGRCVGDQLARDMAYHQGTVWPWLIGGFITGYVKTHGATPEAIAEAREFLKPLEKHLCDAGIGSISEIADGDTPHTPRGTPAQAWSVGEVLRCYWEDILRKAPKWPHEK